MFHCILWVQVKFHDLNKIHWWCVKPWGVQQRADPGPHAARCPILCGPQPLNIVGLREFTIENLIRSNATRDFAVVTSDLSIPDTSRPLQTNFFLDSLIVSGKRIFTSLYEVNSCIWRCKDCSYYFECCHLHTQLAQCWIWMSGPLFQAAVFVIRRLPHPGLMMKVLCAPSHKKVWHSCVKTLCFENKPLR